ncbi:MAG: hypothetical protein GC184_10785 [Rhizobiales bacterium]|nr:hypothetical protein [Hyphomicrobiales bacterium]
MISRTACLALFLSTLSLPALATEDGLSSEAMQVVTEVKTTNDINIICKEKDSLKTAVKAAVVTLVSKGELTAPVRGPAKEAGRYIYQNCGKL